MSTAGLPPCHLNAAADADRCCQLDRHFDNQELFQEVLLSLTLEGTAELEMVSAKGGWKESFRLRAGTLYAMHGSARYGFKKNRYDRRSEERGWMHGLPPPAAGSGQRTSLIFRAVVPRYVYDGRGRPH